MRCFTDGCPGQVKLAQELEAEAGVETHRRELLRLPDQARKPRNASPERAQQERPEQRRGRRKAAVQRPIEPGKGLLSETAVMRAWARVSADMLAQSLKAGGCRKVAAQWPTGRGKSLCFCRPTGATGHAADPRVSSSPNPNCTVAAALYAVERDLGLRYISTCPVDS